MERERTSIEYNAIVSNLQRRVANPQVGVENPQFCELLPNREPAPNSDSPMQIPNTMMLHGSDIIMPGKSWR